MSGLISKRAREEDAAQPLYSVCTLVTDMDQYDRMVTSFFDAGFSSARAEYMYIDNIAANKADAYLAVNAFICESRSKYVIICHQDILLNYDGIDRLAECIREVESIDPDWCLIGNSGGDLKGSLSIRISDPHGNNTKIGKFPAKVCSLDENFILIRRSSNIGTSNDLRGFHLYGLDLCLMAATKGGAAYVVDFHLTHLSTGQLSESFFECKNNLIKKYERVLKSKYLYTTCDEVFISGYGFLNKILNANFFGKQFFRLIFRAF